MRRPGSMDPGSGFAIAGHFAIIRRPNATVDANAIESCFARPAIKRGGTVSLPPLVTDAGADARGVAVIGGAAVLGVSTRVDGAAVFGVSIRAVAALSAVGCAPASGRASWAAVHAAAEIANREHNHRMSLTRSYPRRD